MITFLGLLGKLASALAPFAVRQAQRDPKVIRILEGHGLRVLENTFESVYAHAFADAAVAGKPRPLLDLLCEPQVVKAFRASWAAQDPGAALAEIERLAAELAVGDQVRALGLDPRAELRAFVEQFRARVAGARSPGDQEQFDVTVRTNEQVTEQGHGIARLGEDMRELLRQLSGIRPEPADAAIRWRPLEQVGFALPAADPRTSVFVQQYCELVLLACQSAFGPDTRAEFVTLSWSEAAKAGTTGQPLRSVQLMSHQARFVGRLRGWIGTWTHHSRRGSSEEWGALKQAQPGASPEGWTVSVRLPEADRPQACRLTFDGPARTLRWAPLPHPATLTDEIPADRPLRTDDALVLASRLAHNVRGGLWRIDLGSRLDPALVRFLTAVGNEQRLDWARFRVDEADADRWDYASIDAFDAWANDATG